MSDADIRLIRIFRAVVESGGFSSAEVELNISISAISIAVADLEKRLGLKLCQRGRAGFSLTDEGNEVYQSALQLLASLEDFKTRVNSIATRLKGELNIGITDNLVTMHNHMRVTNALAALKDEGPDVRINIRMMPPAEIEKGVLDARLHIGVIPDLKRLRGLDYIDLYDEESRLYCGHRHRLFEVPERNLTAPLINQQDAVSPASAVPVANKAQLQHMQTTASATDREGAAFLILSGRYIGFLPIHYAQTWVEGGKMRALLPDDYSYSTRYAAVSRRGARPNMVVQAFLNELNHVDNNDQPTRR